MNILVSVRKSVTARVTLPGIAESGTMKLIPEIRTIEMHGR